MNFHPILAELAKIDTDSDAYEKALHEAVANGKNSRFSQSERCAVSQRASADPGQGPTSAGLVQASDLRARVLYRVRGEDAAWCSRSGGSQELDRGESGSRLGRGSSGDMDRRIQEATTLLGAVRREMRREGFSRGAFCPMLERPRPPA